MMGGENKTTQTSTSRTASQATPYAGALLDRGLSSALNNYNRASSDFDYLGAAGTGATALHKTAGDLIASDRLAPVFQTFSDTYGNGGFNAEQRNALDHINPTARGDFVNLDNPDFQRVLDRAIEDASTEASMVASGMGRSGSDFHQGLVARTVGDLAADARLGQYNLERERQANAIGQLFDMGQTGMGNVAQAGNVFQSLYDARSAPATSLMALGQVPSSRIADLLEASAYSNPFARLLQEASGNGTTAQPTDTFGQIAGGLLGGASLLFG